MWENLLASWRQSGQKKDHCPSLLNHNAKYKRLLPPCCDFANGVRWFVIRRRLLNRCVVSFLEVEFSRVSKRASAAYSGDELTLSSPAEVSGASFPSSR